MRTEPRDSAGGGWYIDTRMTMARTLCLLFVLLPGAAAERVTVGGEDLEVKILHQEDFSGVADRWRYDGRGRVWVQDGRLQMEATGVESTAWFTGEMETPLLITYEAHILDPVEASNINLIFLASATDGRDVLKLPFTGSYSEYHKIPNYIWTITNTHTRLRRDPGFEVVSEDTKTLPEPHRTYRLALTVRDGAVRCYIDGRLIHSYKDPKPHVSGKLAFRAFHTRLWWDNLKIYRISR